MRRRYGFTLIELLVVIAIIAILAAILFPVSISASKIIVSLFALTPAEAAAPHPNPPRKWGGSARACSRNASPVNEGGR